jgi:hypothetical protein
MADASRTRMCDEVVQGGTSTTTKVSGKKGGEASSKRLLIRGCGPQMAARAQGFLPPLIGNAQMTSCTDDDTLLGLLSGDSDLPDQNPDQKTKKNGT